MKEQTPACPSTSSHNWWDQLEDCVRGHIQRLIQTLVEDEVTER